MKKEITILLLILCVFSFGCGASYALPTVGITNTQTPAQVSTDVNSTPETAQIVGSWNIREQPGEGSKRVATWTNVEVVKYGCKPAAGGEWCEVEREGVRGWMNRKGLR